MTTGTLYIVSAPSGAGKTSLVAALLKAEPRVFKSVSYTTRAARPGERNGRDYHFVGLERFTQMVADGEFLETARVHENHYGTSRRWVDEHTALDHDIVLEIDWQGALQVRRLMTEAVGIFVMPPNFPALEARLRGRGLDSADVIERRLAAARGEMAHFVDFDYVIINDDFDRAAQDLTSIIRSERLRIPRQHARHRELFDHLK